jgi:hypothetical protein
LNVNEFYIGPLFGGDFDTNVPSIEDDATDPADPDNLPNIILPSSPDCDKENGSHSPAGNACAPTPAFSMPMNGRLLILFGYPPLGLFTTSIVASPTLDVTGPAYWNFLIDLNQDGEWGSGEWVAQDVPVTLTPGQSTFVSSGAFRFPTSGSPWGRLKFPLWARSMVTLEKVKDYHPTNWDGSGIPGGFSHGEVEDYFIEWKPIGPFPPPPPPPEPTPTPIVSGDPGKPEKLYCLPDQVVSITCPETITSGDMVKCDFNGTPPGGLYTICNKNFGTELAGMGLSGETSIGRITLGDHPSGSLCDGDSFFDITYQIDMDGISLQANHMPENGAVILSSGPGDIDTCYGTYPIAVTFAAIMRGTHPPDTDLSGVYVLGPFLVVLDKAGHVQFVGLPDELWAYIFFGSIHIEGDPPWVNVSGDFNEEDGSFYATGRGTVAGFPNIAVTFEGTLTEAGISGELTMGAEGGLPQGEPIVYQVSGTKMADLPDEASTDVVSPTLPAGVRSAIDIFVQTFNAAFQDGDVDTLHQLLHPAVFELYGVDACRTYLNGVIANTIQIEVVEVTRAGAWNWEIDDQSTPLDFIYKVVVDLTFQGQTSSQEFHLSLPGDDSVRWFTDCGEPLTQ